MFERASRGIELTRQSLRVLREEKSLLVFPLLSSVACLLVLASFAVPLAFSPYASLLTEDGQLPQDPLAYVILFAFYFVNYFVIVFFNTALACCAIARFRGADPTVADGLQAATSRLPQIAGWAAVSATVGLILKLIESRSEKVGAIVAGLLGAGWSVVTYFVVPIIVVERLGPIDATKRSFAILRKTWGESLAANFGIGLAVFLAMLVSIIPLAIGFVVSTALGSMVPLWVGMAVTVVLALVVSLVSAALHAIIVSALYLYAAEGQAPPQFDEGLLREAYRNK